LTKITELHNYDFTTTGGSEKTMNTRRRLFVTVAIATAWSLPRPCWAATAALPWDYTLIALQDMLVSYIAPAAIGLALTAAVVLYTLGGRDEQAGRLFGSALGGCIALAVVYLLNYVLP
jgi:hypothetical protein